MARVLFLVLTRQTLGVALLLERALVPLVAVANLTDASVVVRSKYYQGPV